MIARVWHGTTRPEDADAYLDYLNRTGAVQCREKSGNRGIHIFRRIVDGKAEFIFVSLWNSMDAIRAFAGPDLEKAVYYPEDERFLLELEPTVTHYDAFSTTSE